MRASLASIADNPSALTDSDAELLHERVNVAVDQLKSMGWPVERIIVRLKQVASEVGFRPSRNTNLSAGELQRRETIWADTITHCIQEYYRQGPTPF